MKRSKQKSLISEFEKTSLLFLSIFLLVVFFAIAEIIYFGSKDVTKTITKKREAVSLIKLPDLAIVTEATWLRHRSISNVFTVFPEDGALLDYYPASFVYKIYFPHNKKDGKTKKEKD